MTRSSSKNVRQHSARQTQAISFAKTTAGKNVEPAGRILPGVEPSGKVLPGVEPVEASGRVLPGVKLDDRVLLGVYCKKSKHLYQ